MVAVSFTTAVTAVAGDDGRSCGRGDDNADDDVGVNDDDDDDDDDDDGGLVQ